MRLTPAEYREERERAAKRRADLIAPIMLAAKAEFDEYVEACRPARKGRPKKGAPNRAFVIEPRDPLEIPGRFRRGNSGNDR